jgi:hypothetical protein
MYSLDLIAQLTISRGLAYLRAHPDNLDDIFAMWDSPDLKNAMGDRAIKSIKKWFADNDIPVRLSFNLTPQSVPAYSIHLAQAVEDIPDAFFGDHEGEETTHDTTPDVKIFWFVPEATSIDSNAGTALITVPSELEMCPSRTQHKVRDFKQQVYDILDINTDTRIIQIDLGGLTPDLSKVQVESFIDYSVAKRGATIFNEQVDIGIHAHADPDMVLWMYYILLWILFRFKPDMERMNLELTTVTASDFTRDNQYLGENIFSRWVRLSGKTFISWKEENYPLIDTITAEVDTEEKK